MALSKTREVAEGTQPQGVDEIITYTIDVSNWESTPSVSSVVVKQVSDGSDVTATVMPAGSESVSGDIITLKPLKSLTADVRYKVEVLFTAGGSTYETFFFVVGET